MCTMRISCLSGHISTTRDHPNGQPPSAVLHLHCLPSVVLSEGGLGPLGSEGSPCRGAWGVVHEHSERPSSPRPAAMASGCLPLQPLCPQLNWSHPSWMAPKGTPQLCPVCSTKGPFFFLRQVTNLPNKEIECFEEWKQLVMKVGVIPVMIHLQLFPKTGVYFQRRWLKPGTEAELLLQHDFFKLTFLQQVSQECHIFWT